MCPNWHYMQNTEEWWHTMFKMHANLIENFDVENKKFLDGFNIDILQEFKQELESIPYTYAKPYDGLGIGASFVKEIAAWYDDASNWSSAYGDYDAAVNCLGRALDYYCDPILDFDDDIIDEANHRLDGLVSHTIIGIYEGHHNIYNE